MAKWNRQPPPGTKINMSHPLANGLVSAYVFDNLRAINLVNGRVYEPLATHNLKMSVESGERAFRDAGVSSGNHYDTGDTFGAEGSILWRVAPHNTIGGGSAIDTIFGGLNQGAADGTGGMFYWDNEITLRCLFNRSPQVGLDTGNISVNIMENMNVCWAVKSGAQHVALNGKIMNSSTSATTWATGGLDIGGNFASANLESDVSLVLKWDRLLSREETAAITANPWQIFVEQRGTRFMMADPLPQTRSLTVPQVWKSPPPIGAEIDWSHPLAHKLVMLARPVNETLVIDDVYGDVWNMNQAGIDVDEGRFLYSHPLYGRARSLPTASSATLGSGARDQSFDTRNRFTSTDLSMAAVYQVQNTNAGGNSFFGISDPGGGDLIYLGQAPFNVSSQFQTAFSGGTNTGPHTGDDAIVGEVKALAATFFTQGATSTNRMWLHNMTTGAKSTSEVTGLNNINPAALNSDLDRFGFAGVYNAAVYVGAIWDRQLSVEEMDQFTSNPWQIYKRDPMHVPIEYQELTFDSDAEERLFMFPQRARRQP